MRIKMKDGFDCFTIDYYSDKWGKYNFKDLKKRIEIAKPLLEPIINFIKSCQDCHILDIGTGPGTIPFTLIEMIKPKNGIKIVGIDPSSSAIQFANQIAKELKIDNIVQFKEGSFENIPFTNNTFDIVISNASFNLSTKKKDAIIEMSRVVKDSGKVIIADCFKRKDMKIEGDQKCNNRLWAVCISGAVERSWLIEAAKSYDLHLKNSKNLTDIVTNLIQNGRWDWKEFIEFNLEYHIIEFIKGIENELY